MASEYPTIQINNKLVEIDEEEQESLSTNSSNNDNDSDVKNNIDDDFTTTVTADIDIKNEKNIHIFLKSSLSDEDTQDLAQGRHLFKT